MTLLLGIAAPWGMWQSSDHRLTELPSGDLITDTSIKHLGIKAPDGTALLTYTGFGRVGGEDVSDWLRKTLRGENRGLEDTGRVIAERATARMGQEAFRLRFPHIFLISAFLQGEPFVVAIANLDPPYGPPYGHPNQSLRSDFAVTPIRVVEPVPILAGGGVPAVTDRDRELLRTTSRTRPNRPDDYLGLLAAVNRRATTSHRAGASTVSAGCVASHLPPDGTVTTRSFGNEPGGATIEFPPWLSYGIDSTEVARAMERAMRRGESLDSHLGDAYRRMVEPLDE